VNHKIFRIAKLIDKALRRKDGLRRTEFIFDAGKHSAMDKLPSVKNEFCTSEPFPAITSESQLRRDSVSRLQDWGQMSTSCNHIQSPETWRPTTFVRFQQALGTSMGTARVVTDTGPAYIKPMGNPEGPHSLACEWVGTRLAQWFGLPTSEFVITWLDASVDEILFLTGGFAACGPAFVTRAMRGLCRSGESDELYIRAMSYNAGITQQEFWT
jgi:hypothetical protein